MKRYLPHIALCLLWFLIANLYQSFEQLDKHQHYLTTNRLIAYVGAHAILMLACVFVLLREAKRPDNFIVRCKRTLAALPIPRAAKAVVGVVLMIQLVHITLGVTNYPFADVGMFRWAKPARELPTVLTVPKYYYYDAAHRIHPLEIRKQHIWATADLLGWGYNNEYTFSANYHYKGQQINFHLLSDALRARTGIDTLWVGLQTVDFATGKVSFDPDLAHAVAFNDNERVFYGPLYIPEYQRQRIHGIPVPQ